MTKLIYKISFVSFLILQLSACTDWEQNTPIIVTGGIKTEKVILIEEFTGASCPNCPAGTSELERISDLYPDNIVIIGVHSKFLAEPVNSNDPDLRTPDSENIEKFLGNYFGKPEAAFNRKLFSGKSNIRIGRPDSWINFVEEELTINPVARLSIQNNFDESTRELSISLTTTALEEISFPLYLHIAITESEIHTAQKNSSGIIDDFIHKHVLRKLITPTEGAFLTDKISKSSSITKNYKFTLPTDTILWNADNVNVVAFISKNSTDKTVIQATEGKIK